MKPFRIIIVGVNGRMGSRIAALAAQSHDIVVAHAFDRDRSLQDCITDGEAVIDFTEPQSSVAHARVAAAANVPIVIGTTGFSDEQKSSIIAASKNIPILLSPNMSVGVNVLLAMAKLAAKGLPSEFKVDIVETHHLHKKDQPSGTAKALAETVAQEQHARSEDIPIQSFRTGDVIGDHTIRFANPNEAVTLTHHAFTRDIFASGALTAARWIVGKKPGMYNMLDVLGF